MVQILQWYALSSPEDVTLELRFKGSFVLSGTVQTFTVARWGTKSEAFTRGLCTEDNTLYAVS